MSDSHEQELPVALGKQLKRVKEVLKQARFTEVEAGHHLQEEAFKEISEAIVRVANNFELQHKKIFQ